MIRTIQKVNEILFELVLSTSLLGSGLYIIFNIIYFEAAN